MIRCSNNSRSIDEEHASSSSSPHQQHDQQQQTDFFSSSSLDPTDPPDSTCSWWGWMVRASSPSAAALLLYPSCGDDQEDGDAVVAISPSATFETKDEVSSPTSTATAVDPSSTALFLLDSTEPVPCLEANCTTTYVDTTNDDENDDSNDNLLAAALAKMLHQDLFQTLRKKPLELGEDVGEATITEIRHVAQLETWDCGKFSNVSLWQNRVLSVFTSTHFPFITGMACMQMILQWLSNDHDPTNCSHDEGQQQSDRDWMLETLGTTSIWTIDLILLLEQIIRYIPQQRQQQHVASYLFLSKMLGVNDSHSGIRYYQRGFLDDQRRVKELFQEARQLALPILQYPNLPLEAVIDLVSRPNCIAMALVDNTVLQCNHSEHPEHDTYQGHYVLLCGISRDAMHLDEAKNCQEEPSYDHVAFMNEPLDDEYCFALLNPARSDPRMEFVTPHRFEMAWRATGTDDDIVFIVKHTE
jgi:hypothetical protein